MKSAAPWLTALPSLRLPVWASRRSIWQVHQLRNPGGFYPTGLALKIFFP